MRGKLTLFEKGGLTMSPMKKGFIFIVALSLMVTLVTPLPVFAKAKYITIASGWVTGVYYPFAGAVSRILWMEREKLGVRASVESSGASVANSNLIANKDAELALLQNDIANYAYYGKLMFKKPIKNMRGIATLYPETCQIQVRKDAGIKSVADLRGKRVAIGPLGSGTEQNAKQILEVYGLTVKDLAKVQQLTSLESADFMKDGRIDAAFYTVGVGAAALTDTALMTPCDIVRIDDAHYTKLHAKYPFYAQDLIKAGTYKGLDSDAKTVAVMAMLVTRKDLKTDLVYNVTKAIFENLPKLHSAHAKLKAVTLESAMDGMSIPLHPGAEKYFKEKGIVK
jgi:TRAP transporter TAXI family solute receptor